MKQIPLLQGKALLVELPENFNKERIRAYIDLQVILSNDLNISNGDRWETITLPPGNWRIVVMLSEVTESEAAQIVKLHATIKKYRDYLIDNDRPTDMFTKTALESLDSAIVAEGYAFQSAPKPENKDFYWGYLDDLAKWEAAQSRVLSRERCLLLGRE